MHIENFTKLLFLVILIVIWFKSPFLYLFHREIDIWHERRSNSDAHWELQHHDDNFQIERKIAHEIMETVKRLQLPLKLDQLTEGRGNCIQMSIIQQYHRPEICQQLKPIPKNQISTFSLKIQCKEIHHQIRTSKDSWVQEAVWRVRWTSKQRVMEWQEWQEISHGWIAGSFKQLLGT